MDEQPLSRNAVRYINDKPQLELTARELVFRVETANPSAPIYMHMRPYTFDDLVSALNAVTPNGGSNQFQFIAAPNP